MISILLSITILGAPLYQTDTSHTHKDLVMSYVTTHQDGMYTHPYITGVNPITGTVTYGKCRVMCEIEYYTYRFDCCSARYGDLYPLHTESHGTCRR